MIWIEIKRLRTNDSSCNTKDFVSYQVPTTNLSQVFLSPLTCVYNWDSITALKLWLIVSVRWTPPLHECQPEWSSDNFVQVMGLWFESSGVHGSVVEDSFFRDETPRQWVMIPNISKEDTAFVCKSLDTSQTSRPLKMRALYSFETSETDYPVKRRHMPGVLGLWFFTVLHSRWLWSEHNRALSSQRQNAALSRWSSCSIRSVLEQIGSMTMSKIIQRGCWDAVKALQCSYRCNIWRSEFYS